jgi:hypothetical protein
MFIIECFRGTNVSFKQGVLKEIFNHPLLNDFMLEYLKKSAEIENKPKNCGKFQE